MPRHVFEPLGMTDTGFQPPPSAVGRDRADRALPVPRRLAVQGADVEPLRGVVHDPTARRMGGVAGHAGLFSTAARPDPVRAMLLGGGELGGVRVLSPLTVAKLIAPATPAGDARRRAASAGTSTPASRPTAASCCRVGSFGHTGFTGTSIWVDPAHAACS